MARVRGAIGAFVGLPCTGKSTWAQTILTQGEGIWHATDLRNQFGKMRVEVVEFDEQIGHMSLERAGEWKRQREKIYIQVHQRITQFGEDGDEDTFLFILLDDNFFLKSMRRIYYSLARIHHFAYVQLIVPHHSLPISQIITSDASRSRSVGRDTIERMAELIEYPDENPSSWESNSITLPPVSGETSACAQFLEKIFDQVSRFVNLKQLEIEEELRRAQERSLSSIQSQQHTLDLALRRIVGETLQLAKTSIPNISKASMQVLARSVQEEKRLALSRAQEMEDDTLLAHYEMLFHSSCLSLVDGWKY